MNFSPDPSYRAIYWTLLYFSILVCQENVKFIFLCKGHRTYLCNSKQSRFWIYSWLVVIELTGLGLGAVLQRMYSRELVEVRVQRPALSSVIPLTYFRVSRWTWSSQFGKTSWSASSRGPLASASPVPGWHDVPAWSASTPMLALQPQVLTCERQALDWLNHHLLSPRYWTFHSRVSPTFPCPLSECIQGLMIVTV